MRIARPTFAQRDSRRTSRDSAFLFERAFWRLLPKRLASTGSTKAGLLDLQPLTAGAQPASTNNPQNAPHLNQVLQEGLRVTTRVHLAAIQDATRAIIIGMRSQQDEEVEGHYQEINKMLKEVKSTDVLLVIGDFNAKIGEGSYKDIIGAHGLGERNPRGDRLAHFCIEKDLVVTNTIFQHHTIFSFCILQFDLQLCKTFSSSEH